MLVAGREPPVLIRTLDPAVQLALSLPCPIIWLPVHSLQVLEKPGIHVIAVENIVNLMTLPPLPGTMAVGGLGNAVLILRHAIWMRNVAFTYLGEVDSEGFEILSRLRAFFPNVQSIMMDTATIEQFRHLAGKGNERPGISTPPHLTQQETEAFAVCIKENLRLEQERIPHAECCKFFTRRLVDSNNPNDGFFPK